MTHTKTQENKNRSTKPVLSFAEGSEIQNNFQMTGFSGLEFPDLRFICQWFVRISIFGFRILFRWRLGAINFLKCFGQTF